MATTIHVKVPVVVVGGSLNSLGVIRSLSSEGMVIYALETTRHCPAGWSRFCQLIRVRSLEGHSLIEDLKKVAIRIGKRPVLILTDDRAVESVSAFRDEIEPWYRINLPSDEMVRTLADKTLFQKFAEAHDLPVPRSITLDGATALTSLQQLSFPVVIKPANKAFALNGWVERAVRADSYDEATRVAESMLNRADCVIVQEWIDGPDTEIFFTLFTCDSQGRIAASFTGRKIVCDPPGVGNTAVCVSAPEATEALEGMTQKVVAHSKYRGLGSIEFKRDRRNGQFFIVEPTVGRTDWQEEIATLCGINLPLIAYQTQLYATIEPHSLILKPKYAWRSSRMYQIPSGELKRGTKIKDAYFRVSDPIPALYHYGLERFVFRIWEGLKKMGRLLGSKPIPEIEVEKEV